MLRVVLLVKNPSLVTLEPLIALAAEAAFLRVQDPVGVASPSGVDGSTLVSVLISPEDYATIALYNIVEELSAREPLYGRTEFPISEL